jgi:ABC-type phosphate transport system permease subunit
LELSSSQKTSLVFVGAFLIAGIVLSTMVFPFWNLIREDTYEEVTILSNDEGLCYVETTDTIPKVIEDCTLKSGDVVTIKFGEGLAWATIVEP